MTNKQKKQRDSIMNAVIENQKFNFDVVIIGRVMMITCVERKNLVIIITLGESSGANVISVDEDDSFRYALELPELIELIAGLE